MGPCNRDERKLAKRARNHRAYEQSKAERDHVLLRLERGGAAALDELARAAEMSRSACLRMFLPAILAALGSRLSAVERARALRGLSLRQFLERALDAALADEPQAARAAAAAEFDELFG